MIDPSKGESPSEVVDVTIEDLDSGILVGVVRTDGVSEYFAYDPAGATRTVLGQETGAKLLCLLGDKDGKVVVVAEE